ncbi:MAG: hypothetical protein AB1467_00820 [Candidatus Diapherotrites archaeon]
MKRITSRKNRLFKTIIRFEERHKDKKLITAATRRLRRAIAFSMRKKRKIKIVFVCDSGMGYSNQLRGGFRLFAKKKGISKEFDVETFAIRDIDAEKLRKKALEELMKANVLICAHPEFEEALYGKIKANCDIDEYIKMRETIKNKIIVMNVGSMKKSLSL